MKYRELDGDEWRCFNGHVDYGEGFVPLDYDPEKSRRRQPSR